MQHFNKKVHREVSKVPLIVAYALTQGAFPVDRLRESSKKYLREIGVTSTESTEVTGQSSLDVERLYVEIDAFERSYQCVSHLRDKRRAQWAVFEDRVQQCGWGENIDAILKYVNAGMDVKEPLNALCNRISEVTGQSRPQAGQVLV